VRTDRLVDAGRPGEPSHHLPGGVTVEPAAGAGDKQRPNGAPGNHRVDCVGGAGRERHGAALAALARQRERTMPTSVTKVGRVGG
jgi:hypothetical protein